MYPTIKNKKNAKNPKARSFFWLNSRKREAHFHQRGVFNHYNHHWWHYENSSSKTLVRIWYFQERDGEIYGNFCKYTSPGLLKDKPLRQRATTWGNLDRRIPNKSVGRGGLIQWPPRSPDLTSTDFWKIMENYQLSGDLKKNYWKSSVLVAIILLLKKVFWSNEGDLNQFLLFVEQNVCWCGPVIRR